MSRSMQRRIAAHKGLPIPMFSKGDTAMNAYAERVRQLEAEGMTTSDAQGAADLEMLIFNVIKGMVQK